MTRPGRYIGALPQSPDLAPCPSYPGYYARADGEIIGPYGRPLKELWKHSGSSGPFVKIRTKWVSMERMSLDALRGALEE